MPLLLLSLGILSMAKLCSIGLLWSATGEYTRAPPDDISIRGATLDTPLVVCEEGYTSVAGECHPDECLSEGIVCGGHGRCIDGKRPRCECEPGFVTVDTHLCVSTSCLIDGGVCPNGNCVHQPGQDRHVCVCKPGYLQDADQSCISISCVSRVGTRSLEICNGHGICHDNRCKCNELYTGELCELCRPGFAMVGGECVAFACLSYISNPSLIVTEPLDLNERLLVCDGFGQCLLSATILGKPTYHCKCNPGALAIRGHCLSSYCHTEGAPGPICSGHGYCNSGTCICQSGYGGLSCEKTDVDCPFGTKLIGEACVPDSCVNGKDVCSGLGVCVDTPEYNTTTGLPVYICECPPGYHFVEGMCVEEELVDKRTNTLCTNGLFIRDEHGAHCTCNPGFIGLPTSLPIRCVNANCVAQGEVCGGVGECINDAGTYSCKCPDGYGGEQCTICSEGLFLINRRCVPKTCTSQASRANLTLLECGGYGTCRNGACICRVGTTLAQPGLCVPSACLTGNQACSGLGQCIDDHCICDPGASGLLCEKLDIKCRDDETVYNGTCVPAACISRFPELSICGGHGVCARLPEGPRCKCDDDYVISSNTVIATQFGCVPTNCLIDNMYCPYGACISSGSGSTCVCDKDYEAIGGARCIHNSCVAEGLECSGHGLCAITLPNGSQYSQYSPQAYLTLTEGTSITGYACQCDQFCTGPTCTECVLEAIRYPGGCAPIDCLSGSAGFETVCNGAGACQKIMDKWKCVCTHPGLTPENTCMPDSCFSDGIACSGRGICHQNGCVCARGFHGGRCELGEAAIPSSSPNDQLSRKYLTDHKLLTLELEKCAEGQVRIRNICYPSTCIFNDKLCGQESFIITDITLVDPEQPMRDVTTSTICMADLKNQTVCVCPEEFSFLPNQGCIPTACIHEKAVCPHGTCVFEKDGYKCRCNIGFEDHNSSCVSSACISNGRVCGSRQSIVAGVCVPMSTNREDPEAWKCNCYSLYTGKHCESCAAEAVAVDGVCAPPDAITVYPDGSREICGGSGHLRSVGKKMVCVCNDDATLFNGTCAHQKCLTRGKRVCSGHGSCRGDTCVCESGYNFPRCRRGKGAVWGITLASATFFALLFRYLPCCC
ncbi:High cysteine membrane protein [Giardia muris]|uniref:High cysteine membrane protein n=1 Tax=Giardia muris TaxID=5742 RepID=A0A4Z1T762_GIAMU|nr:High cysteine membrane protein [Giardia muris]|eukprot:TNJ28389.1 High cysteine membrane protein [Giardia muris]